MDTEEHLRVFLGYFTLEVSSEEIGFTVGSRNDGFAP